MLTSLKKGIVVGININVCFNIDIMKRGKISLLMAVLGTIGGLLYWKFVGCISGQCVIPSTWYLSALWGGIFGWLLGSFFETDKTKNHSDK